MVDESVLVLAILQSLRGMEVEMTLVHNWVPIDGINVFNHTAFIVEHDDMISKGFFHLGQKVSVHDGYFLGCFIVFGLKIKMDSDLLHFVIKIDGNSTSFGSGGGDIILLLKVGFGRTISWVS
jgi:hypothetical protein